MSIKIKMRKPMLQLGALMMTAGLSLTSVVPAMAESAEIDTILEQAQKREMTEGNVVDSNRLGSLSIYKYDITAAEEAGAYQMGSIRATGQQDDRVEKALEGYGVEGVQFSYMRVGDVETHETSSGIQLVYELPDDLAVILDLSASEAVNMAAADESDPCHRTGVNHFTSEQISDALADLLAADNVAAKNELEGYLYDFGTIASTEDGKEKVNVHSMPYTNTDGFTQVSNLELGLYLVVETEVPETVTSTVNPWFVQLPFTDQSGETWLYDMTCYPKNQTGYPTLNKSVRPAADAGALEENEFGNTATASQGDTLEYTLVSRLPHISSEATYLSRYTFVDDLSAGLTYNKDVRIAFYHEAESAAENRVMAADLIWDKDSDYFKTSFEKNGDGTRLTVTLSEAGLKVVNGADGQRGFSDNYMVVYYSAGLNEDASVVLGDAGNPNDVQLTWSRTSDGYYETLEDRNYVYSYGLDLTKEFSDQEGHFDKVQFRLFNGTDEYYVVAKKGTDGVYTVTGQTDEAKAATVFVPSAADGTLQIRGMEADTYQLTEIATDDGYSLLRSPIRVEITATDRELIPASVRFSGKIEMYEGEITPAGARVDRKEATMEEDKASENALAVLHITNSKGFLLPQTGGSGLYAVTILGVMTAAAGCFLATRRRKDEE